jgi:hypothetical protein
LFCDHSDPPPQFRGRDAPARTEQSTGAGGGRGAEPTARVRATGEYRRWIFVGILSIIFIVVTIIIVIVIICIIGIIIDSSLPSLKRRL